VIDAGNSPIFNITMTGSAATRVVAFRGLGSVAGLTLGCLAVVVCGLLPADGVCMAQDAITRVMFRGGNEGDIGQRAESHSGKEGVQWV